ncbi:Translocation protein S66 [Lithohypha guttulata]|uniref:Translocation protein S66 n=1 Tax=Lithohypha guttulata TaxID=1690604 RepID=A0AAN7Y5F1_9EURO|nr:Translocation protein S66 [Lithohypha guttulata]KAK5084312.1 Translocation protein S66 [Lithohypha guttulata]KAK5106137.1 Translocation protein S66 [Lithohypha guttulata]
MQRPTLQTFYSLLIPIIYLTILPYFPIHTARNVYLTLLHQTDTQADLKTVPNSVLMAALQERACEDILRIREIQTRKGPLNTLLQRGVVGDDIWQRLLRAEQELEAELKDVQAEANALAQGWGQTIFQSANEIVVNRMTKQKIEEKRSTLAEEKEAWEKVKEQSRLELEGAASQSDKATTTTTSEKTQPKTAAVTEGSDEDAVMVEKDNSSDLPYPTPPPDGGVTAGTSGGTGKAKKKKGKK